MLGALLAQYLRHLDNDVFCQIGLVMLVGLASKNAILIVEFANHLKLSGLSPEEAVKGACETRFRPILMTSLAFVSGILPLVFATGAGAASRHSLGTAVCGGMIFSTVLSLYIVPVIYLTVGAMREKVMGRKPGHKGTRSGVTGSGVAGARVAGPGATGSEAAESLAEASGPNANGAAASGATPGAVEPGAEGHSD
jgi:HAE1 family hydrophobic/amphiphilic exporter-1